MRKHTIIGMAGHIDHGKTALIKALTGIETDRLKEEQERGITIDIGFAYWKDNVTIIDVPGHEKFVRNMVAGVSTVDLFMLVIAADDGIMPQTIEHLDILKFFNVRDGVVALNKVDLVDEEWLLLVQEEIDSFLEKNGFRHVPVIPVSAVANSGINELRTILNEKIERVQHIPLSRPFRLNIDRIFSAKGFGSVVTGTVLSATVSNGDRLLALPQKKETRVRGLQVHQKPAETAYTGQRTAINLSNISKEELARGAVLVEPESVEPTVELLAEIITTDSIRFKIKRHFNVRVHLGTSEIIGRIDWFENKSQLEPNQTYHVRIKLNEKGVAAPGDPVLIRSFSPVTTIAGGKVLQIDPPGLKRLESDWLSYFKILTSDDISAKMKLIFDHGDFRTFTTKDFRKAFFERKETIDSALSKLLEKKLLFSFNYKNKTHFIADEQMDKAVEIIAKVIEATLSGAEFKKGLNFKELENQLRSYHMSDIFLERTLQNAAKSNNLYFDGEVYSTKKTAESGSLKLIQRQIADFYKECRFNAPDLNELSSKFEIDPKNLRALTLELAKNGFLKSIGGQYYLHSEVFEEFILFLKSYFAQNEQLGIATVKEFTRSTRKWIIPLVEFSDNAGYTERRGDVRLKGINLI